MPFCQLCTPQNSLAYSCALNKQSTQDCSLHSFPHRRQPISAMFSTNKILQHNLNSNIPYRFRTAYALQFLHTGKTDHICHAHDSNYIAANHNIIHSACTSTCTTVPILPTPLSSTALLCTQLTNTKDIYVGHGKMAQNVGMV